MGKLEPKHLRYHDHDDQNQQPHDSNQSSVLCRQCSLGFSRLLKDLSFKCVFVLLLGLAILVFGLFSVLPLKRYEPGFDAQESVKISASAQAYFVLEKPVAELIPRIGRLQYDITAEIGVPVTKVVILSMHKSDAPNRTAVVFGTLPDPISSPISLVSLSLLKSSLIEVFMNQTNLTLTTEIFGQPSKFEILKFQGGITVIPDTNSIWEIPQILFNFTLNNFISEIMPNILKLKDQLKFGLRLRPEETVFVQLTSAVGSTTDAPVVIQASVVTTLGSLTPQRLRQLAETLSGSPPQNLGLDHSLFGKVKSVSLSSYLRGTLSSLPPSPSPAPTPEPIDHFEPTISPGLSPQSHTLGPQPCPYFDPELSPSPNNPIPPPALSPHSLPMDPKSQRSPGPTPAPLVARASSPRESKSLSPALSASAAAEPMLYITIWSLGLSTLTIFHLLFL